MPTLFQTIMSPPVRAERKVSRDPASDPRPGDTLFASGRHRVVLSVDRGNVHYHVPEHDLNLTIRLADWSSWTRWGSPRVVKLGDADETV